MQTDTKKYYVSTPVLQYSIPSYKFVLAIYTVYYNRQIVFITVI